MLACAGGRAPPGYCAYVLTSTELSRAKQDQVKKLAAAAVLFAVVIAPRRRPSRLAGRPIAACRRLESRG